SLHLDSSFHQDLNHSADHHNENRPGPAEHPFKPADFAFDRGDVFADHDGRPGLRSCSSTSKRAASVSNFASRSAWRVSRLLYFSITVSTEYTSSPIRPPKSR